MDFESGNRLFAKYFTQSIDQLATESQLLRYAKKAPTGEIVAIGSLSVLYKVFNDVLIAMVGGAGENEVFLSSAFSALTETLEFIYKGIIDKQSFLNGYELFVLLLDEAINGGVLCEVSQEALRNRMISILQTSGYSNTVAPPPEKTLGSVFADATKSIASKFWSR